MGRSDQEKAREKYFTGLGCAEARKHAYASSHMHGTSTHMNMNNHMYNVDPHVSSQYCADAFGVVKYNVLDAVHQPTASQPWLYDNNLTNSPANGSLAFAAMRRPWSNAGGRQQFLCFNSSQEQRLVERVNDAYQMIHARGHENAVLGSTALNCNNFLIDHSGSGMMVFPFVAPVLHKQALTVRVHQIPTAIGRALIPPLSVARGASTRMLPADSSVKPQLTIFYAGKVNVYNDVSSIKAQEIMLMAAACNSLPLDMDMFSGKSMPMVTPPVPRSLINADPPELSQTDLPTCKSDQLARDQVGAGASIPQAPHAEESSMPGTQSTYLDDGPVVPRALPQARKASLARFLEKRKERMLSKSPYPVEKKFL